MLVRIGEGDLVRVGGVGASQCEWVTWSKWVFFDLEGVGVIVLCQTISTKAYNGCFV